MKRKFALLLVCALAFALLAGCQAKPAGEPEAEAMRVWLGACADAAASARESMLAGQALLEQARIAPPKARISVARTAAVKPQAVAHALAAEAAIKDEWIRWHKPAVLPPVQTQSAAQGLPYYIMVNRAQNTVTVYTKDADGNFTVPFKAMVCSTGRPGCETPTGEFSVMSFKAPWCYMIDGSYGQYSTGFR
ncbi:MAG: L,D-transpeptidase, partial [Clostridia bacterium]|nr:L,D-transpeptidase [Clostridia bacterium]